MKKLLVVLLALSAISSHVFACEFQGQMDPRVKAQDIECNENSRVAIIKNPKVEIDGKFYNIIASYGEKHEYWETTSSETRSTHRERKTTTTERKKQKTISYQPSRRAFMDICRLFGFSGPAREYKVSLIYSYLHKAYSFDHDMLGQQSIYNAPFESISCY